MYTRFEVLYLEVYRHFINMRVFLGHHGLAELFRITAQGEIYLLAFHSSWTSSKDTISTTRAPGSYVKHYSELPRKRKT